MIAFRTTSGITKKDVIESLDNHREQERIARGNNYWNHKRKKGCGVGCTLHDFIDILAFHGNHKLYEQLFGIPEELAILQDVIFEEIKSRLCLGWSKRFISSINEGSDLSEVGNIFIKEVVLENESLDFDQIADTRNVFTLYYRRKGGDRDMTGKYSRTDWHDLADILIGILRVT